MAEPFAFQPLDAATRRDPFAHYARGRREHPVFLHEGLPLRVLSVFRHADVQAILRDADAWSNVFQLQAFAPELAEARPPSMLGTDPPEHTRLRSLVGKAFTPRIVQRLEGRMAEISESLLDEALAKREVDLDRGAHLSAPRDRDRRDHRDPGGGSRPVQGLVRSGGRQPRRGLHERRRPRAHPPPARALRGDARLPRAPGRGAPAKRAAVRLAIRARRAKFKLGQNRSVDVRARIANELRRRGRPNDERAAEALQWTIDREVGR
jgi:hypothetical protein